ncbi:MAG TPA: ABC transporter permease [Spirochaetia bacterium]|nr:ABC transporter permease [Spirochaetia bacterium]HRV27510.1 ABC transporter permease [Spirochaetia bacterium]
MIARLALRTLWRNRNRYKLLFLAIFLGFSLVVLLLGVSSGALAAIKQKASRYFAGQITIRGYRNGSAYIENPDELVAILKTGKFPFSTISKRSIYYHTDAAIYYGGESVRQRRLVGVNFEEELKEFSTLPFLEGSAEAMLKDKRGILISKSASKILGAHVGDAVLLYLTTNEGQANTAELIVQGIFNETSLFGYAAYVNYAMLNELVNLSAGSATDIALYFPKGVSENSYIKKLHSLLAEHYPVLPLVGRKDLTEKLSKDKRPYVLTVISLDANLDTIKDLLDALTIILYLLFAVFLLVIMTGIMNTYRVILFERTVEIGTMRALGIQRNQVLTMFLLEAFFLAAVSALCGFIAGTGLLFVISKLSLKNIPGAGLFTNNGFLMLFLKPSYVMIGFILLTAAVLLAVQGPARRASLLSPAEALREII